MTSAPSPLPGSPRTTPLGMLRYGIEYYAAAVVTNTALGRGEGTDPVAPASAYYLIGHAVELGLKAYVLQQGGSLDHLKAIGHRLCRAHDEARKAGLAAHFHASEVEVNALRILDALYSDKQFEYIETGGKTFPDFGLMQTFARNLLIGVSNAIPQGGFFLRTRHSPGRILLHGWRQSPGA